MNDEQIIQAVANDVRRSRLSLIEKGFRKDGHLFTQDEVQRTTDALFAQLKEYQEIMEVMKPLLYALSLKLYGEDTTDKLLHEMVEDAIKLIQEK